MLFSGMGWLLKVQVLRLGLGIWIDGRVLGVLLVWPRKFAGRRLTRFGGCFLSYRPWWQDSGLGIVWLVQGLGFGAGFEFYDCVSPECCFSSIYSAQGLSDKSN